MSDEKTSNASSYYLAVLASLGIAALVLGVVVLAAGGTPAFLFIVGGILVIAWLIIKAAKS